MTDTIDIKIRGYHLDVFGHVNNARYLEFLEEARWALFDDKIGLEEMARDGFAFTVVNININYRRPAFLHDILCVETRLAKTGARSATLRQVIKNKKSAQTVADAEVTFVMLDVNQQKAAPLAGDLTDTLIAAIEN